MSRRGARSSMDYKNAVASAADSLWGSATPEACEADPAEVEGYDATCRFRDHPLHTCVTRDMVPVHPGQVCWYEAQADVADTQAQEQS